MAAASTTPPTGSLSVTGYAPVAVYITAPTGLVATASGDSIDVSWTDTNNGSYQPRLYWKRSTDSTWDSSDLNAADTTATLSWLVADTSYDVGVTYFNGTDETLMASDTVTTGTIRLVSGSFL